MTEGKIYSKISLFALPIFIGQLFQQFYNVADSLPFRYSVINQKFIGLGAGKLSVQVTGTALKEGLSSQDLCLLNSNTFPLKQRRMYI